MREKRVISHKMLAQGIVRLKNLPNQIYDTNIVIHGLGEDINGIENWKQFWSDLFDAFPDYQATFDDRIVKGDKVVTRYTGTGTHKDTNKKWTHWGISLFRRTGGKIVEEWIRPDTLRKMQQLGVVPTQKKEE